MSMISATHEAGQLIWLDDLSRAMLDDGTLEELRDQGVSGITANPTIFDEAISSTDAYDRDILARRERAATDPESVFWDLAVSDCRRAADVLRDVHDRSGGGDGFVSLELAPSLAFETDASIEAGLRLFERLDRPNVMIKVPGTRAGVGAIEELTARGVNVNVTLLFGPAQWEAARDAHRRGLERATRESDRPLSSITSVASLFLSRIDVAANEAVPDALHNRAALATAAMVLHEWRTYHGAEEHWRRLDALGARPQRLLWASTSTKDPALDPTHYVARLRAPDTVVTVPRSTFESMTADDADGARRLDLASVDDARTTAARLADHGLTIDRLAERLQEEGVDKFAASFDSLLASIRATAGRGPDRDPSDARVG